MVRLNQGAPSQCREHVKPVLLFIVAAEIVELVTCTFCNKHPEVTNSNEFSDTNVGDSAPER